jgi:5'-nucleotidase
MKYFARTVFTALLLLLAFAPAPAAETVQLTILHTNDYHAMLDPFDYRASGNFLQGWQHNIGGMARAATFIKQTRAQAKNPVIVIDAGDVLARGPRQDLYDGLPQIEAMNLIGYDLFCVGNHEFYATSGLKSQEKLFSLIQKSRFPWLGANVKADPAPPASEKTAAKNFQPFVIRRYGSLRVGFLGLTTARYAHYPEMRGWQVKDPLEAAKYWVPKARKQCDILIAVTHLKLDSDRLLASRVAGIDVIIGGDSHTFLATPVRVKSPAGNQVSIVQAGEFGVAIGRLDLTFEKNKTWKLIKVQEKLTLLTKAIAEDPKVKALLKRYPARHQPLTSLDREDRKVPAAFLPRFVGNRTAHPRPIEIQSCRGLI